MKHSGLVDDKFKDFGVRSRWDLKKENMELSRLKINTEKIEKMFGCSIHSLIPFELNDNILLRYTRLFDGYCRENWELDGNESLIPFDITKIISFYYPVFSEI